MYFMSLTFALQAWLLDSRYLQFRERDLISNATKTVLRSRDWWISESVQLDPQIEWGARYTTKWSGLGGRGYGRVVSTLNICNVDKCKISIQEIQIKCNYESYVEAVWLLLNYNLFLMVLASAISHLLLLATLTCLDYPCLCLWCIRSLSFVYEKKIGRRER